MASWWRTVPLARNWESKQSKCIFWRVHWFSSDQHSFNQFVSICLSLSSATLRSLPQLLSTRMRIKTKLKEIVKEKSRQTGTNHWKRALNFVGFCSIKSKHFVRNTVRDTKFWYDSMKEIEGYFGAGVETYFRFFRFLFVINIFLMIIPLV